jgi:hypothetical protein
VAAWSDNFSFIGNVMGRPGLMTGWSYTDPMMGCDANGNNCVGGVTGSFGRNSPQGNIWQISYDPTNEWTMQMEPSAMSTVIRDGNYDYLTNSVHWHNTPAGFAIPNSLYLSSAPAEFSGSTWPWVNPLGATQLYSLPAKARYDAGTPFTP